MAKRIIYHVDVNSAFLSWTACDILEQNPSAQDIREIPSAICGDPAKRHGIILAKSTPAKKYGVVTAEPIQQALRKCPMLQLYGGDYQLYARRSHEFMELLRKYAPEVDPFSVDEAFCDMTGTQNLYGDLVEFAHKLKDEIYETLGFTVNIGVAENRLLAKMASDFQKPNRVHTLFPEEIATKMWPLPVGDLLFVGKSSTAALQKMGIRTIGDLANTPEELLVARFKSQGHMMWRYANGIDESGEISHDYERKGYSHSVTLPNDIVEGQKAKLVLLSLCEVVAAKLRRDGVKAGTIAVGITDCEFVHSSRQKKLYSSTDSTQKMYETVVELFDELWSHVPIRLLRVSATNLGNDAEQINLFDMGRSEKQKKLDRAIDSIRNRFGEDSVVRASFVEHEE
ncbi:MAG: DNA polymerase IV [Lachnospiraceae bacterium]|nr:DNA polymerase IV [Lachnospiraceae bacterium]MBR0429530.1 DNA polymerase IV [Lachnospiraceae bacterium]